MNTKRIDSALRELEQLRAQVYTAEQTQRDWAREYLQIIEAIPGGMPDGRGTGFSPLGWIKWAKKQTGYGEATPPGCAYCGGDGTTCNAECRP